MANKINYKLVNTLFILLIVYLIYMTSGLWFGIIDTLWKIIFPFIIAFVIAYALTPMVEFLREKAGLPKGLAITFVILFFVFLFGFVIFLVTPNLIGQTKNIFDSIITFFKELSIQYSIDFDTIQNQLSSIFTSTIEKLGTYISNGAINIIGMSLSIISNIFIVITAFIYFMIDMDKIKKAVKDYAYKKSKKIYTYLCILNTELENYLSGFVKICFISFFQYTIMYAIIGHPDALMLGTLAGVSNLIPYFGGIITNIVAAITAFVISPELFIKTIIVFVVFSAIDGNVINPLVYGKTNKIHPLIVIISVFAGGILFGITGIIVSLPVAIIIIATIKFFKTDIDKYSKEKIKKKKA